MKKRGIGLHLLALALCAVCGLRSVPAVRAEDSATAASMRLMKTEGTVSLNDGNGKKLSVFERMLLRSGYQMETKEKSYAWINLDDTKLIKMDAVSEAAIQKDGKKLEVRLNAGALFFNVTEPLAENESLNVRISTAIIGIRGTSGWVRILDSRTAEVSVLEGTVYCHVTDPISGQVKEGSVTGGETVRCEVYLPETPGDKCAIVRQKFDVKDIPGFVLVDASPDDPLCEKVLTETGLDIRGWNGNPRQKLREEQAEVHRKLDASIKGENRQAANISTDPVWADESANPTKTASPSSEKSDREDSSSSRDDTPPDDPAPPEPGPPDTTLTMPVTPMDIESALRQYDDVTVQS